MTARAEMEKLDELVRAFALLQNADETRRFLRDLLTESELTECANRWRAARMLSTGRSYLDIARETGLSSTTIARVSKWLSAGKGGYGIVLERMEADSDHHTSSSIWKGLA